MEAIDVMVKSLIKLISLTDLHVHQTFDRFTDQDIVRLARSLPKLEKPQTLVVVDNRRLSHRRYLGCGCVSEIAAENRT